jgi:deoxyribodipyrimidine photo-lyase
MRTLVLFTRDLRIHDHPALAEASREGSEVVPLFVLDPKLAGVSPNRERFLHECLADLDRSFERLGGRLLVRRGVVVDETMRVVRDTGCSKVLVSGDVSSYARRRERGLADACERMRVGFAILPENAVVEPGGVSPAGQRAYRVFTPYLRAWAGHGRRPVSPPPQRLRFARGTSLGPRPDPSRVGRTSVDLPRGGERAGRRRLHAFLGRELAGYPDARDDLAADETSRLSPYLRFGCISANEVAMRADGLPGSEAFLRQLAWRDFFFQLVAADPTLAWRNLREPVGVAASPVPLERALAAWREGCTGIPLVDAGMRQLDREGWMHNRARLVAASFLTRSLGVAWQHGERHFARLLVDADPANNAGNWQWAAGTGTDPRRTRTLAPVRQARRYDASGDYVRRYVKELVDVEGPTIFAPWKDPAALRSSGYPAPIVPVNA